MYPTLQIDHILITKRAIYVVETKHIPEDSELIGGSNTKKWKYIQKDKNGKEHTHGESNADKQNQKHVSFLENMLRDKIREDVIIYSLVVLDGIKDKNVKLNLQFKHEVVCLEELADKINYLDSRIEKETLNINFIKDIICEEVIYDNIIPQIPDVQEKHLYYVKIQDRNIRNLCKRKKKNRKGIQNANL